jgi:hypothetical protein
MRRVFEFLELPDCEDPATAQCRRLRNRTIRHRVCNWDKVYKAVPSDIRKLFDAEDLF